MNERIKELAEQAGYSKEFLEIGLPSNMEKFAELIIHECANVCESTTQQGQPLHLVSIGYADRIKKHFGVE